MPKSENYKSIFIDLAKSKGYKILYPNKAEANASVDLKLEGQTNGKKSIVSVDIKKKNGKSANTWVYIEFQNSKGGDGWIYGQSNFIAFETNHSFILVPRKKLLQFLSENELVRWDLPFVDKPWNAKYRLYRRPSTLEKITQIKVEDLNNINNINIWQKH